MLVVDPDGSVTTLNSTLYGKPTVEGDRLWLGGTVRYVKADAPTTADLSVLRPDEGLWPQLPAGAHTLRVLPPHGWTAN